MTVNQTARQLQRFDYDDKRQRVCEIETMISDFRRIADDLDHQIKAEQQAVGISDINHFAYPTFARAAMSRRDNLLQSISELERRLELARAELEDLHEELKRNDAAENTGLERLSKVSIKRKPGRFFNAFTGSR
jgi:multidrug resistance efflux pump